MATGIAKPGTRTTTRARGRIVFSLVLVIALFASATSAFGVAPTKRYTRVSVSGDTYALAGLFPVEGVMHGLLGTSTDDGASWSLGLTQGEFWGASAWPGGPVWGAMDLNLGLWTGSTPAKLDKKSPPDGPTYEWRDIAADGTSVMAVGARTAHPYGISYPARPATIWKSTNDGDTWTEELLAPDYGPVNPGDPVPAQPAAVLEGIDAVSGLAVAVGTEFPQEDFNFLGSPKQALIFTSTDGGSTWTQRTAGNTVQMLDVDVVSSGPTGVVWAVGSNNRIFRSVNGGVGWQNWAAQRDFGSPTGATTWVPLGIAGVDDMHAYVVGTFGKVAYISGDPAVPANWTFKEFGQTLNSIASRDESHAVAVGDNGLVLRTTTGMAGWVAKTTATTPGLGITAPATGFTLGTAPVNIAGASSDAGLGVAQVQVRLQRSDAKYWDGDSWDSTPRWIAASTSNGWANWDYTWTDDGSSKPGTHTVEIYARSINGGGNTLSVKLASAKSATTIAPTVPTVVPYTGATVTAKLLSKTGQPILGRAMNLYRMSGTSPILVKSNILPNASGVYSYKLAPVNKTQYRWSFIGDGSYTASNGLFYVTPQVRLYVPKATRSSSTYTVTTYISPKHSSKAVRIYAYRYANGKWSTSYYKYAYAYAYAYNYNTTRMVAKLSLPRGTWRFRAYAPADSYHAYTWSGYSSTYKY